MKVYKPCILTPRQFLFMQAHHEQIIREWFYRKCGGGSGWLEKFIASDSFRRYFGDMLWDDVIDGYEDTPGYSWKLWKQLHQDMFNEAINNLVFWWW